jgi:CHASE3 domain sensor protein
MRLSMPPFLPPYAVLFLVVAYAAASLWFGLGRLDDITRQTEAATRNAETIDDLQALLQVVNAIDTAGPAAASTSTDSLAETFERERRRVPILLSALRDKVRDDASELALVEELVPLLAERTTLTASRIERRRSAPDPLDVEVAGQRGKKSSARIRAIIASLELRQQERLEQSRQARIRTIDDARRDLYVMAGVTLLLVTSLFLAVRRLRSFLPVVPGRRAESAVAMTPGHSPDARDAGMGTLLRDALLRARLAEAGASANSNLRERLRSLVAAVEQALSAHAGAYADDPAQPEAQGPVRAVALLAQAYSHPEGLTVDATIDRSIRVTDPRKAFLIVRTVEWALEAITLRKRSGEVTLELVASGDHISLRIHALTDSPELPVTLTPRESEDAKALRQGLVALAGTFIVGEGPAGFFVTLGVPTGT